MGLANIREMSGSIKRALFGRLSARDFIGELRTPDRGPIDYTSPVKLQSYKLQNNTPEGILGTETYVLPENSYRSIERLLTDLELTENSHRKIILTARRTYAHEYLVDNQVLNAVVRYAQDRIGLIWAARDTRLGSTSVSLVDMYDGHSEYDKTLAHLEAARVHLWNRRAQFKSRAELKELHDSIVDRLKRMG